MSKLTHMFRRKGSGNNISPKTRSRAQTVQTKKEDEPPDGRTVIRNKSVPLSGAKGPNNSTLDGFTIVNDLDVNVNLKSNTLHAPTDDTVLSHSNSLRMEFNPLSTPPVNEALSSESNHTNINPLSNTEMHHEVSLMDLMDIESEPVRINIDESESSYSDIFSYDLQLTH